KGVARRLPYGGRFRMDRPLPFVAVYRHGLAEIPREVEKLATVHASYSSFHYKHEKEGPEMIRQCAGLMGDLFGAFLVLEVWPDYGALSKKAASATRLRPFFEIRLGKTTAAALPESLTIFE